jgi:hypothetical protein
MHCGKKLQKAKVMQPRPGNNVIIMSEEIAMEITLNHWTSKIGCCLTVATTALYREQSRSLILI